MLGPIRNEGNEMVQALETSKGNVVPRRRIGKLEKNELLSEIEKQKCACFDKLVKLKYSITL